MVVVALAGGGADANSEFWLAGLLEEPAPEADWLRFSVLGENDRNDLLKNTIEHALSTKLFHNKKLKLQAGAHFQLL